jgi:epoxyqueuosine reductase
LLRSLREWAAALGFSQIGVADVDCPTPSRAAGVAAQRLSRRDGLHGAHGLKRARPAELVPGTVRVITARMDYLPRDTPTAGRRSSGSASATAQAQRVDLCPRPRLPQGVARAAAAARRPAGRRDRPFGHRVFTDSAPVLEVELAVESGLGWRGKHTLC